MRVQLVLALMMLFGLSGSRAYPIPVDCRGAFHEPVVAPIIQQFGHLAHVGVDYGTTVGTKIYAAMDGIVMYAIEDSRVYGRSVFILGCDGYGTLYGHLSKLGVKFGQIVKAGQLIGLSGGDPNDDISGDGMSSCAHLHFEVRVPGHLENNLYNIDPGKYEDMVAKYGQNYPGVQ